MADGLVFVDTARVRIMLPVWDGVVCDVMREPWVSDVARNAGSISPLDLELKFAGGPLPLLINTWFIYTNEPCRSRSSSMFDSSVLFLDW